MPEAEQPTQAPPSNAHEIHPVVTFLQKEWRMVKSWAFWTAVGIVAVGIFSIMAWHYKGTIDEKDATIIAKDATIKQAENERDSYMRENEKLTKQNEELKVYRGKDAPPLKRSALILANQISDYIKNWKDSDPPATKDHNVQRYLERFGTRVVLMREDLDQNGKQSDKLDDVLRNWVAVENYDSVRTIASELKKLAESLDD